MYRNLKFFNKSGNLTNFSYDTTLNKWVGQIDMGLVSVDLISSYQLFVMEDVLDVTDSTVKLSYPIKDTNSLDYIVKFKDSVDDIFIYNFTTDDENDIDVLEKSYESYMGLKDSSFTVVDNIKNVSSIDLRAASINLALWPRAEDSFFNTILIIDPNNSNHVIGEFNVYGESEGEDERLTTMLTNMGIDLLPTDIKIFKESDVNEEQIDWILLNRKKKELLLEHSNIFPYMGSYKALINILKYFGYSNVRLKEYWQNIDDTTANYGKFKQVDIAQIFTAVADYIPKELINSKIWNKTNKFGLFYDITIEDTEVDDRGTPYTKEVFTFTPDEILIKIFALKKKLQQKFLPINAKIVDIIGEAVLFGTYSIGHMHTQNVVNFIDEKLDITLICPKTSGYIDDLRYLERASEIDILDLSQLELTQNEIALVKEYNWAKSTYLPNDLYVNIGFPLILNVDFNLTWDMAIESYDRLGGDTSSWNTIDLFSQWSLTNLTYEIESSSKVFKYVKDINLFNTNNLEIGLILPYKDTYSVKVICKTAQNFEHVVYKKDFIDVKMYNADFISFYSQLNGHVNWLSKKNEVQKNILTEEDLLLKWSDMSSIWDTVQCPNESIGMMEISYDHLDLLEYKQNIDQVADEYASLNPLVWSKMKYLTWEESSHLWWDNIGTSVTQWTLFGILDLDSLNEILINGQSVNLNYLEFFNSKDDLDKLEAVLFTVKQLNEQLGAFSDFIYYYEPYYELSDTNNDVLKHDIKAISKKFSSTKQHTIYCQTSGKSTIAKEATDLGFIGDSPAFFDIYKKNAISTSVILTINKVKDSSNYIDNNYVTSNYFDLGGEQLIETASILLTGSIQNYLALLNNSTDSLISSFIYSLHQVKGLYENSAISYKISAISKFTDSQVNYEITLNDWSNVVVTPFARPIVKNPSYQNINIVKYSKELPSYSRLFLTYDNCLTSGIHTTKWTLSNSSVLNFKDIYLNSDLVSYLFTVKGSYDITLDITDKNGNTNNVTKTEFIKII